MLYVLPPFLISLIFSCRNESSRLGLRPTSLSGGLGRSILKPAFSEPLNVLSPPFTPPTPEDVGLGFYTDEGTN